MSEAHCYADAGQQRAAVLTDILHLVALFGCLSFLFLKTNDIFRKAVHGVVCLAKAYYKLQLRFDTEQVSDIMSALNLFGEDRQSHQAAGDFLYFTAKQKGGLDNREHVKARREVDNVVDGNYDQ